MCQEAEGIYIYGKEGDSNFVMESACHRYLIVGNPILIEKDGKTEEKVKVYIHDINN